MGTAKETNNHSLLFYWPQSAQLLEVPLPELALQQATVATCCMPVSKNVFVGTNLGLILFSFSDLTKPWRFTPCNASQAITSLALGSSHLLAATEHGQLTVLSLHST